VDGKAVVRALGLITGWLCITLAVVGLLFRVFIWASWVPAPGAPYGISDVLEMLLWFGICGVGYVCLLFGLLLALIPALGAARSEVLLVANVRRCGNLVVRLASGNGEFRGYSGLS
jgi:hypothetical protein